MKLLYDTFTDAILAWPRWDDESIENLDERFLEMDLVEESLPEIDRETEKLECVQIPNIQKKVIYKTWNVVPIQQIKLPDYDLLFTRLRKSQIYWTVKYQSTISIPAASAYTDIVSTLTSARVGTPDIEAIQDSIWSVMSSCVLTEEEIQEFQNILIESNLDNVFTLELPKQ